MLMSHCQNVCVMNLVVDTHARSSTICPSASDYNLPMRMTSALQFAHGQAGKSLSKAWQLASLKELLTALCLHTWGAEGPSAKTQLHIRSTWSPLECVCASMSGPTACAHAQMPRPREFLWSRLLYHLGSEVLCTDSCAKMCQQWTGAEWTCWGYL